jgi:osomolarity two-component system, response regulator SKN7
VLIFALSVRWAPGGDFPPVIRADNEGKQDVNKFTKPILPRMLKHSNFASFARQLNKYDFHKVRASLSPCVRWELVWYMLDLDGRR